MIGDKAYPQLLQAMGETMKEAVAMDIRLLTSVAAYRIVQCAVRLYQPTNRSNMVVPVAARKERLRLSAIAESCEQVRKKTIGDSAFSEFSRNDGRWSEDVFFFYIAGTTPDSLMSTFVSDLGLSIARNANLVRAFRIVDYFHDRFLRDLFSFSPAFPSLQSVYLEFEYEYSYEKGTHLPPHIMKHLRSLMRNKDNEIEEVRFSASLLSYGELLDDTLRSVRSFQVDYFGEGEVGLMARSLERTKAEGDKLVRVSLLGSDRKLPAAVPMTVIETILRSRPNLQVLELGVSDSNFNVLCAVVAPSFLTTLKVGVELRAETEYKKVAEGMGKLLQHPTIRDLEFHYLHYQICRFSRIDDTVCHDLVQSVAEGLRATRLRRFCWTMITWRRTSSATMTKLCECVRENRNLMDIRLSGKHWGSSSKDISPCPFAFLDFISLRNQYLSQVLKDENSVPPGLWPLFLESTDCNYSILYYLLTLMPHLVLAKGIAKRTVSSVDGLSLKHTRMN